MASDAAKVGRQVGAFLTGLTPRQRWTIAASVVGAAGALYAFVALMSTAEYRPLYSGLAPSEGATLVQHLLVRGISAELSSDGSTLSVAAGKLDQARLDLASEGLPRSGHLGFEIFDKPNWAGSDFVEQVNYQRALEGELERTIESMSGIAAVRVHLALTHDSLYTDQQRDAKAAVMVKIQPGARLTDTDLSAITFLVSSAIDNMKPEDVQVVDATGHVPLLSHQGAHSEQAGDLENALTTKLVDTLAPLVGEGQVRASVTAEFENGSNESTQESYDSNDSVVLNSQMTADDAAFASQAQGIPGSTSNVPQAGAKPAAPPAAAPSLAGVRNEAKTFGVGKTVRRTVQPAGSIRRLSAAIAVDDAVETTTQNNKKVETRRKRTPDEMKQIEALAAAAIGINTTRGDQLAVVNLSFVPPTMETPAPPTLATRLPALLEPWLPELRYLGYGIVFIVLYLLILRPLKRQLSVSFAEVAALRPAPGAAASLAAGGDGLAAGTDALALADGRAALTNMTAIKDTLSKRISSEPVPSSRVVQEWMRQK